MKTFLVEIGGEEAFVEANSKAEAIDTLVWNYGFDREEIIIYHEVDEDYADIMGLDIYWVSIPFLYTELKIFNALMC